MTGDEPRATLGWQSDGLRVIPASDARYWSIADAASLLGPPVLTERQLRDLLGIIGLQPAGKRPAGPKRRHVRVYEAIRIIAVYDAVERLINP